MKPHTVIMSSCFKYHHYPPRGPREARQVGEGAGPLDEVPPGGGPGRQQPQGEGLVEEDHRLPPEHPGLHPRHTLL